MSAKESGLNRLAQNSFECQARLISHRRLLKLARFSTAVGIAIGMLAAAYSYSGVSWAGQPESVSQLTVASSCTPQLLQANMFSYSPPISPTQAGNIANGSSQYAAAVQNLGPGYALTFVNPGITSNFSQASCVLSNQSYDVAYSVLNVSTNVSGQLSIYVSPNSGSVTTTSIWWPVTVSTHASSGQWTGYTTASAGRYTATYAGTSWTGFGASGNYGNCGAGPLWPGLCKISFWTGLTHTPGGKSNTGGLTGPGAGIAQSGIDSAVWCVPIWIFGIYFGISCYPVYTAWYEFYPSLPYYCSFGIGSSNALNSFTGYQQYSGAYQYWSATYDWTTGSLCYGHNPMSGTGTPVYGQFQSESDLNPIGGLYQTPNFNFWYNPAYAGGYPADLIGLVANSLSVSGVTLGAMNYNSGACPNSGSSCFQIS